ncbi:MAG: hypothetical protein S0880_27510 [Actinomycetota bacterium]|nr:hypothetical protein [Actinomycetota bacterium]
MIGEENVRLTVDERRRFEEIEKQFRSATPWQRALDALGAWRHAAAAGLVAGGTAAMLLLLPVSVAGAFVAAMAVALGAAIVLVDPPSLRTNKMRGGIDKMIARAARQPDRRRRRSTD